MNRLFLDMVKTALLTDRNFGPSNPSPSIGLKAFGRIYASWAYSEAFFSQKKFQALNYLNFEQLLDDWSIDHTQWNGYDLLAMIDTWLQADISDNELYQGDLNRALKNIRAKTLVIQSQTDMYFPPSESDEEQANIPDARYKEIPSIWGHMAGSPKGNAKDQQFIEKYLHQTLNEN